MKLKDLVCGDMEWALVSNYMIDMGWVLSACPALARVGALVVVHGEKHDKRYGQSTSNRFPHVAHSITCLRTTTSELGQRSGTPKERYCKWLHTYILPCFPL